MSSAEELPSELCTVAHPFVVLTGLDITYNAVHTSIWDAFSNRRREKTKISFACLPGDHQYPHSKAKRSSYEWYIPKGLLKTSWMKKHLSHVPSVVVVFFELDWDDPAWRERHQACASRVQVVRTSLHGRSTKVAVVLIQKASPLPPGEDMIAVERAAALCSACELSAKSLFVLPHSHTDHLPGYAIRLENAFYDLAQAYYHNETRRVKAHKDFLNKTTHQLLFPRHQFKIGFYSELLQDSATALKHYQQSYNHIHELRLHDSNNLELKVVGGFVNYKICRLCFLKLGAPIDAIEQFKRHIELFKPLCGSIELLFEHSAWLSKQFLVFGDLFNDAIASENLKPGQTQHPGFYYQRAAHYAQIRKQLAHTICNPVQNHSYPEDDPLKCEALEYYGQRPWRQGHQRIDLSDTTREKEGILALKLQELKIDHSRLIIPLLSYAVSQFKKYHCPRLKHCLSIEMGKEYYHAKDFEKAITLLKSKTLEYRERKWFSILTHLLVMLLDCSYMICDVNAYFAFASELISHSSLLPKEQKATLQKNVQNIVYGHVPKYLPVNKLLSTFELKSESGTYDSMAESWNKALSNSALKCVVEVHNLLPFVECKVIFSRSQFTAESCITLFVCVMVTCPVPLQFSELLVIFNNPTYDQSCSITSSHQASTCPLYYEPYKLKVHEFEFPVHPEDLSKSIQVQGISIKLASQEKENNVPLTFKWSYLPHKTHSTSDGTGATTWTKEKLAKEDWRNLSNRTDTQIVKRISNLDVEIVHSAPALVGEVFPIRICITSNETVAKNISVFVSLEPGQDEIIFQSTFVSTDASALTRCIAKTAEITFGDLPLGANAEKVVYICSSDPGRLRLTFQTSYVVHDIPVISSIDGRLVKTVTCSSAASTNLQFDVLSPFTFNSHVTSLNLESTSIVNVNDPFIVLTTLTLGSEWPIEIVGTSPKLQENSCFQLIGKPQNTSVILNEGESATDCLNLIYLTNSYGLSSGSTCIGMYIVQWRRCGQSNDTPIVSTTLKLPSLSIRSSPLQVQASLPAFGVLRKPSQIQYVIKNLSGQSKQLDITYVMTEAFMFAGPKQTSNFLPPFSSFSLSFSVIPLALGFQALPQLKIMMSTLRHIDDAGQQKKSESFNDPTLPTHLTVKPVEHAANNV